MYAYTTDTVCSASLYLLKNLWSAALNAVTGQGKLGKDTVQEWLRYSTVLWLALHRRSQELWHLQNSTGDTLQIWQKGQEISQEQQLHEHIKYLADSIRCEPVVDVRWKRKNLSPTLTSTLDYLQWEAGSLLTPLNVCLRTTESVLHTLHQGQL